MSNKIEIEEYVDEGGISPFINWLRALKSENARSLIRSRLNRVRMGNFGDSKSVGEGVAELRIHLSPGFRIYYGLFWNKVILLKGGTKHTQNEDIANAKENWKKFRSKNAQKYEKLSR